jgi:hypothetical protein
MPGPGFKPRDRDRDRDREAVLNMQMFSPKMRIDLAVEVTGDLT